MLLDIIAQFFWFGILGTPVIAFFIVRKMEDTKLVGKIVTGIFIALLFSVIFFHIAMGIFLRNGLGPT